MPGPTTRVRLRVAPGAPRPEIVGRYGGCWKLRVSAAPERGKANDEVLRELAGVLGLRRGDVELVAGHGSRDKVAVVRGLSADEVEERLDAAAVVAGAR